MGGSPTDAITNRCQRSKSNASKEKKPIKTTKRNTPRRWTSPSGVGGHYYFSTKVTDAFTQRTEIFNSANSPIEIATFLSPIHRSSFRQRGVELSIINLLKQQEGDSGVERDTRGREFQFFSEREERDLCYWLCHCVTPGWEGLTWGRMKNGLVLLWFFGRKPVSFGHGANNPVTCICLKRKESPVQSDTVWLFVVLF